MRVGIVQFKADKTDLPGSRDRLAALAGRAAVGADLVVLPEMAVTGYVFPDRAAVAAIAEPADGPTAAALGAVARATGSFVVCGFAERAGDALFNSAMVLDRAGDVVGVYRKTLLYEADLPWATPGDRPYPTFDTGNGTFGVGICMDLNDDRFVAWLAAARPDALAFPTNWVHSDDVDVWSYWAWRLQGLPTALVAANTWGTEEAVQFTGRSLVLTGLTARAWLPALGDGVATATFGPAR
jgi:predicted amidohydrolase